MSRQNPTPEELAIWRRKHPGHKEVKIESKPFMEQLRSVIARAAEFFGGDSAEASGDETANQNNNNLKKKKRVK